MLSFSLCAFLWGEVPFLTIDQRYRCRGANDLRYAASWTVSTSFGEEKAIDSWGGVSGRHLNSSTSLSRYGGVFDYEIDVPQGRLLSMTWTG